MKTRNRKRVGTLNRSIFFIWFRFYFLSLFSSLQKQSTSSFLALALFLLLVLFRLLACRRSIGRSSSSGGTSSSSSLLLLLPLLLLALLLGRFSFSSSFFASKAPPLARSSFLSAFRLALALGTFTEGLASESGVSGRRSPPAAAAASAAASAAAASAAASLLARLLFCCGVSLTPERSGATELRRRGR